MFIIIERKYEMREKYRWSDPLLIITEKVLDVGEKDMLLKKYVKEGGWEKIDDDDLIEKFEKYDHEVNKIQRIIVEIGDVFTKEVY